MNNNTARVLTLFLLLLSVSFISGCNVVGWLAAPWGKDTEKIEYKAQYNKLHGKNIAVLVSADQEILGQHSTALIQTSRAVSERIADNMPDVMVMNPTEVIKYQRENPYWYIAPYEEVLDGLGVDAVVIVNLSEFRTHEPGNKYQWQGVMAGSVTVADKSALDPNDATFYQTVRVEFPEGSKVGVLNSSEQAIMLGMRSLFSRDAAGFFFDYSITKKK